MEISSSQRGMYIWRHRFKHLHVVAELNWRNLSKHPSLSDAVSLSLFVIIIVAVVHNIEESKLITALGLGHYPQPIAQLLLLEVLLGPASISPVP